MNAVLTGSDIPVIEERTSFTAPTGTLEGVLSYHAEMDPTYSVLIAGPHPFMGGDLENNVVRTLARGFAANRALSLTFNYSGVGDSQGGPENWQQAASQFWESGTIDQEPSWIADAAEARRSLAALGVSPMIEVGYSFGCWVIAELPAHAEVVGKVLISPNPSRHNFDRLANHVEPVLVIHSDNDFACPAGAVKTWFESLREPKSLEIIDASEHFFRGQEQDLLRTVLHGLHTEGVL